MFSAPSPLFRYWARIASRLPWTLVLVLCFVEPAAVWAQNSGTSGGSQSAPQSAPQNETKTFVDENGTQAYSRTLERKLTSDGEIEVQQYRAPRWPGDDAVVWEREVRTRKLPDGTIEKQTTVRSPDGANRMQPVQVIRETIRKGADTTTTERDVLAPNYDGHWQPIQKETVTQKSSDGAKHSVEEVQVPNASGEWQITERNTTSSHSSAEGTVTDSVRQLPDSFGQLADYERRDERTAKENGKETLEITVQRRDRSDAESRRFFLVEHTKESARTIDGTTIRHSTTESDLLSGGAIQNPSGHAEVVQVCTEQETAARDGSKQIVRNCNNREAGDPTTLRSAPTVVQQTDSKGYVRQILLPAQ